MSLSLEEIIRKQADKIDQLEMRISELEAENKALRCIPQNIIFYPI